MADLLVAAMHDAVQEAQQADIDAADNHPLRAAAAQNGKQHRRRRHRQTELPALPPPMFPGNYESQQAVCKLGVSALLLHLRLQGNRVVTALKSVLPAWCHGLPWQQLCIDARTLLHCLRCLM